MSGDGFTFEPDSYAYGASRIREAGGDLDQAGSGYASVQGRASGQLRQWAPTVPVAETLDQVEAKLAQATRLGAADLHQTGDKLLASRQAMLATEDQNTVLAERAGAALQTGDRAALGSETGAAAGPPGRIGSLLNAGTPAGGDAGVNQQIDQALDRVNPKYDPAQSAYSENCTSVVQANELQRRGLDAQAGPLEKPLRTDQGGPGGRPLTAITGPWGGTFTRATKTQIEEAFSGPGSRGVVYIAWKTGGAHVFNVENVDGEVRFVDGQPTPPVPDASHYFDLGTGTAYLRLDNRAAPAQDAIRPYLEASAEGADGGS